jgi:hypothetical protein
LAQEMVFVPKVSLAWRAWRRIVRTQVEYFAAPATLPDADVLKLCDLPAPFPGVRNEYRPTILIDLTAPEEELWNTISSQTRKVIRQSTREAVAIESVSEISEDIWNEFLASYQKLWGRKHNAGALGVGQIRELIRQDRYALTRSRTPEGDILSWHFYVRTPDRVRLHTTISNMDPTRDSKWNNRVGRVHRLHHWQDMLQFKREGARIYDFGGVYRGTDDQEQMNIARFKQLFGGHFADTYDAVVPLTLKGRLALSIISHVSAEARAGGQVAGAHA